MKHLFLLIIFLSKLTYSQNDPFDKYGPFGSQVYTDLKLALDVTKNVYKLDLSYKKIDPKLFIKLSKLKDLQALRLSGNEITQLPDDFSELYNLVYFASYNNTFTSFPKNLKNLYNLNYLEYFGSKIDSVPSEIAYLNKLKTLKISSTNDTLHLPTTMQYMKNLKELNIENCILDSSFIDIFNIPNLNFLSLTNVAISVLPTDIKKMQMLEVLVLDANQLNSIPFQIHKLKNLRILSVKNNKLYKLPDAISQLENLSLLDVRGNSFSKEYIEELKALLPGCEIRF
jgi:Leucine-rich repeat (LRR) protein